MSQSNTIFAEIRADVGKGASRRLRKIGRIPAVLYGANKDPVSLTLDHTTTLHAAQTESFYSSILEIKVEDGRSQKVVVRDLQRHPFKQLIMHMDFMRVSATEILRISVPIHFIGEEDSPAGRASGVVIQHLVTEVEIAALPKNLPKYLEVNLSAMEAGDAVALREVKLPEGVEIPALDQGEEGNVMVANAIHISEDQGTGAAAAAEAEAEAEEELGIGLITPELEDGDAEAEDESEAEAEGDKEE